MLIKIRRFIYFASNLLNMLDEIDKKLLRELQINSKRKIFQLARTLNLPRSTIHNRIKKLEKSGIIKTYKAVVNHEKIGKGVTVLVHVVITSRQSAKEITEKLKRMDNVEDIYIVTGRSDIIIKARFSSTEELGKFIFDETTGLRSWEGVESTESMIALDTVKEYGLHFS